MSYRYQSKTSRDNWTIDLDDSFYNQFNHYKNFSIYDFEEINNNFQTNYSRDILFGNYQDGHKEGLGKFYIREKNIFILGHFKKSIKENLKFIKYIERENELTYFSYFEMCVR